MLLFSLLLEQQKSDNKLCGATKIVCNAAN